MRLSILVLLSVHPFRLLWYIKEQHSLAQESPVPKKCFDHQLSTGLQLCCFCRYSMFLHLNNIHINGMLTYIHVPTMFCPCPNVTFSHCCFSSTVTSS
ncbi:hypothetical protein XELAEV_18014606mg [Xenopus laevis]|uniref:Secreted protein n=1 Tax=Xenopus laevis TaxID=8355 RepID=A0A974HVF2_XENLA|nr:hypothetical protein XELAEV_18014606mg [Xenopus laevis]